MLIMSYTFWSHLTLSLFKEGYTEKSLSWWSSKTSVSGYKLLNYLHNSKTHSDFVSFKCKRIAFNKLVIDFKYSDFYALNWAE